MIIDKLKIVFTNNVQKSFASNIGVPKNSGPLLNNTKSNSLCSVNNI